jgi:hypothetical protein
VKVESRRGDANDGAFETLDLDLFADDRRIARESSPPQSVDALPSRGRTPSTSNMLPVVNTAFTRSGREPSLTFTAPLRYAAMSVYDTERSRKSKYSGGEIQNLSKPNVGNWLVMNISRSAPG